MEIRVGSIVRSIAGRDMGVDFVVLAVEGNYVFLSDGDTRKAEKPKKKKLKHIQASKRVSEAVAARLAADGAVTNAELRKALAEIHGNV